MTIVCLQVFGNHARLSASAGGVARIEKEMLIRNEEAEKRLTNPLNLMNRISKDRKNNAMSLFIKPRIEEKQGVDSTPKPQFVNPFLPSKEAIPAESFDAPASPVSLSEEIIHDVDKKVKLALAHDNAIDAMNSAISAVKSKIDDIKAEKLPSVITAMSKVVTEIRREGIEREKIQKGQNVHHHFYMPQQRQISEYEVIEVQG